MSTNLFLVWTRRYRPDCEALRCGGSVFQRKPGASITRPPSAGGLCACFSRHERTMLADAFGNLAAHRRATVIANAEITGWFSAKGIKTHAQHLGGGFRHPFGYLKLTLALHGSALPDGSYGGNPAGFLLTTNSGEKLYLAGDTGLFGDMRLIGEEGLDLAAIPIGDNYTMGPDDDLRAVKLMPKGCGPNSLQHLPAYPTGCERLEKARGSGD